MSDRYAEWIDRVASVYAGNAYADEVARARKEFAERCGRTVDADAAPPVIERELQMFLEWYVLDRNLGNETPIRHYARQARDLDPEGIEALSDLAAAHRTLLSVDLIARDSVRLQDLILGGVWRVALEPPGTFPGVAVGDILDARLVAMSGGAMQLVGTPTFYSRDACDAIRTLCAMHRERGTPRLEVLWEFARRRARSERYRHLPVRRFYEPHPTR